MQLRHTELAPEARSDYRSPVRGVRAIGDKHVADDDRADTCVRARARIRRRRCPHGCCPCPTPAVSDVSSRLARAAACRAMRERVRSARSLGRWRWLALLADRRRVTLPGWRSSSFCWQLWSWGCSRSVSWLGLPWGGDRTSGLVYSSAVSLGSLSRCQSAPSWRSMRSVSWCSGPLWRLCSLSRRCLARAWIRHRGVLITTTAAGQVPIDPRLPPSLRAEAFLSRMLTRQGFG